MAQSVQARAAADAAFRPGQGRQDGARVLRQAIAAPLAAHRAKHDTRTPQTGIDGCHNRRNHLLWRLVPGDGHLNLDPERYWEETDEEDIRPGAVFSHIPLLTIDITAITARDEWGTSRIYLPTNMSGLALLYRRFSEGWWFLPIITAKELAQPDAFDYLVERVVTEDVRGWFAIPPQEPELSPLSRPGVVCLRRPTLLNPEVARVAQATKVGQLNPEIMGEIHARVVLGLEV
jgi:hypothetical protein